MAGQPEYLDWHVLWIEEEIDEYYPLEEDLGRLLCLDTAKCEEEAIQCLEKNRYDLVFLDLMLPKNNEERELGLVHLEAGQRILRELRKEKKSKNWATPYDCLVIVFTARGKEEALAEVLSLIGERGELIQKPVNVDDLTERIRAALLHEKGAAP